MSASTGTPAGSGPSRPLSMAAWAVRNIGGVRSTSSSSSASSSASNGPNRPRLGRAAGVGLGFAAIGLTSVGAGYYFVGPTFAREALEVVKSPPPESIKTVKYLIAGGIAGAVSRTVVSPLERLKILFQIQTGTGAAVQYNGVVPALSKILREEGTIGFFKGNGTNVIRMVPYSAVQFASYEQYKKLMLLLPPEVEELTTLRRLLAGAMAGVTSVIVTYPLDLIRTRLSAQGEGSSRKYTGIAHAYRTILKEEGGWMSGSLYRGLSPTLMGVAPYVALNFTCYELLKKEILELGIGLANPGPRVPLKRGETRGEELNVPTRLMCGALAGAIAQTATYPLDLVRRRMQMKGCSVDFTYTSTLDAFRTIFKREGIVGLYKGMMPNYLKVAPSISISFVTYEFVKKMLI